MRNRHKNAARRPNGLILASILLVIAVTLAVPVYSVRSSSSPRDTASARSSQAARTKQSTFAKAANFAPALSDALMPAPPPTPTILTYASDCTTPKTSFNLGETVCAIITGAAQPIDDVAQTRTGWVSPYGSLVQGGELTSDPSTVTYAIPATALQTFTDVGGGTVTVDNRGVWSLTVQSALDGSRIASTDFTVHDPAKENVDLALTQGVGIFESKVNSGSGSVFRIFLSNKGPDDAHDVVLSDTVPANATFTSIVENSGLGFSCGAPVSDVFTCTLATLPVGATAEFTFAYQVGAGTAEGTLITNVATVSSSNTACAPDSCELQPGDNTSSVSASVPTATGPETCTLTCHENFSVEANTTQSGQPGRFVTFSPGGQAGNCGAITANPASGSFFPVGSTVVNVSSETGGGSCSFTITVVEGEPPTISCPANMTVAAPQNATEATVDPGSPTTNPSSGVTVTWLRSDDPGCASPPCTPKPLTDPYPVGTTGIDWTVTDSNGLTASCHQVITVHEACASDTEPPTITAPANITTATGPNSTTCGVVLDDELGQPIAHDDCSYTLSTSGIPPGNLFPIGTTTITYTVTDGAGHTASATQTVTVTDNTRPVIFAPPNASYTCPSEVPALSPSQAFGPDVNGNPDPTKPVFDNCGSPMVTASQSSSGAGSAASPLIIVRTYTAVDTHGNSAIAMQTITVTDPIPPTFTFVPGTVTAYTGPSAAICGTAVSDATLGTATATDNCSVTVTRTGVPAGNIFPKGNTTVTYTATDGAGNVTTATQTVTVIDNTPPVISCQADIVADFDPAANGAVVTYTAPVGTDNCPGAGTVQTTGLASGATFPLGTTTNTFIVTDGAGLTATCSFKVTVALTSIIGLDSVSISGSGLVDSYNSTGGYPATKGALANILSNGTITIAGSGKVSGNVRSTRVGVVMTGATTVTGNATAGTTVSKGASATIGGTITNNALAPMMTLPSVPACGPPYSPNSGISGTYSYNASTGDLTLSGINSATLANGNYCFHNLTLTNSGQLKVNGPVTIKLTGTLNAGGATSLPNTTLIPSNLRILSSYSGTNGVTFGNSSSLQLVVYAPNTAVSITGSAPLFGTVAGKTLTIGNSGMIHYDTQLKSIWPEVWTLIFGP